MKDLDLIRADLAKRNITVFSTYAANGCIGVSYGRVSCYYYITNGKIVDIIYD
jgi:hypothetical protein